MDMDTWWVMDRYGTVGDGSREKVGQINSNCWRVQHLFLIHPLPIHYPLRIHIHYESLINSVSLPIMNPSIHPLSIMSPSPLSCVDYASIYNPQILRTNIGPKVQNHRKTYQIHFGFGIDLGSPFVHLTKFHRFSGSFFGAHLFSIAIWTHNTMVPMKLTKMCPT